MGGVAPYRRENAVERTLPARAHTGCLKFCGFDPSPVSGGPPSLQATQGRRFFVESYRFAYTPARPWSGAPLSDVIRRLRVVRSPEDVQHAAYIKVGMQKRNGIRRRETAMELLLTTVSSQYIRTPGGNAATMKVCALLFLAVVMTAGSVPGTDIGTKQVMGWRERVRLLPENLVVEAKLDTGADSSSLNVPELTGFVRDDEQWVRFSVSDHEGTRKTFERRVVRVAKIKRHFGGRQERPVVLMGLCIGAYCGETEVNLVDRSRFKCQLLVGRSFMGGFLLVDPAVEHSVEPGHHGTEKP
jgi:hypothetical protein